MIDRLINRLFPAPPLAPDPARFPDLPLAGYDPDAAWVQRAEALRAQLETPQYRKLQAARRRKAGKEE